MRTVTSLVAAIALLFTASFTEARKGPQGKRFDGRWAKAKIARYHKARNMPRPVRVTKVRFSKSGRSGQYAAVTPAGKVRLYNVGLKSGRVSRTRTGLTSQGKARYKANLRLRRENRPFAGTFSGVNTPRGGKALSRSGKTHVVNSNTDRRAPNGERAYVKLVGGKLLRYDR